MIRVLHIVTSMNRGGLETLIMNIYRKINRSEIQFDFLVHTDTEGAYDEEIYNLGGMIYRVVPRSKGIAKNRRDLIDFFKNHTEYKIVHHHVSSLTYIEPIKIAKKFDIPVRIIHGHSTKQGGHKIHKYIHYLNKSLTKKKATHFFACSEDAANWMFGPHEILNINYTIITNAIDPERFAFNEELRNEVRSKYNINDRFVLGHIGRFMYPKNHRFIIEVFNEVKKNEKRAVLLLVGDGKLKSEIVNKIKDEKLEDSVIFTGVVSNTEAFLNAMDVFLFPSLYEGLGIAVIEAQSTGLKCFASTEIPEEAAITDNINRISLQEPASQWAKEILKYKNGYKREDEIEQIKVNNYDINEVSSWIEGFYKNVLL
jgi:glycosyltransferase involved in cell wall biosynthesis